MFSYYRDLHLLWERQRREERTKPRCLDVSRSYEQRVGHLNEDVSLRVRDGGWVGGWVVVVDACEDL